MCVCVACRNGGSPGRMAAERRQRNALGKPEESPEGQGPLPGGAGRPAPRGAPDHLQMGKGAFPCLKIRKREQPPTYTLLTPARSKKRIHEKQEASWPPVFSYSPAALDAIQNPMPRRASEGAENPKDFRWPVLNLIPAVSLTFVLRQRYARRRPPRPRPIHTPPCQQ